MISIDKTSDKSLYEQLYEQMKSEILNEHYAAAQATMLRTSLHFLQTKSQDKATIYSILPGNQERHLTTRSATVIWTTTAITPGSGANVSRMPGT